MSVTLFEMVGRSLSFRYPRYNLAVEGIPRRTETRRIRVERVRDVEAEPLDPMTLALSPLQRRGRYLITGFDDDRHAERSFYFEAMQDVRVVDSPRCGPSEDQMEYFHEGHRAGLCDAARNQRTSAGPSKSREPFANLSVSSGVFLQGGETEGRSMETPSEDVASRIVNIVPVPSGWRPRSIHELPPGFEQVVEETAHGAAEVRREFNALQMREPTGFWAV
jgi:hypothetical protein